MTEFILNDNIKDLVEYWELKKKWEVQVISVVILYYILGNIGEKKIEMYTNIFEILYFYPLKQFSLYLYFFW